MIYHFILCEHGVWGSAADFDYIIGEIKRNDIPACGAVDVTCCSARCNAYYLCDQGARRCAERLLEEFLGEFRKWLEIVEQRERSASSSSSSALESHPQSATCYLSCVGHSFGGIIMREFLYLLLTADVSAELSKDVAKSVLAVRGQLSSIDETRTGNLTAAEQPSSSSSSLRVRVYLLNFITIATPHCGVSEGFYAPIYYAVRLAGRVYGETYRELLLDDGKGAEEGPLLLHRLLDDAHLRALESFHRCVFFANERKDASVGFATASLLVEEELERERKEVRSGSGERSGISSVFRLRPDAIDGCARADARGPPSSGESSVAWKQIALRMRQRLSIDVYVVRHNHVAPTAHVAILGRMPWFGRNVSATSRIVECITQLP